MKVNQVLASAGPVDAVTRQALAYRKLFNGWGWSGSDHAPVVAPDMPAGVVSPMKQLPRDGLVVVHYSGYMRELDALKGRRTLLVSHNITPARYFWDAEPVQAMRCEMARGQLAELAGWATVPAGVSRFNADELEAMSGRPAEVIPILTEISAPAGGERGEEVLFVGRLVPHKRPDLLIAVIASLRRLRPRARLTLVGGELNPAYGSHLRSLADRLAPGAVTFKRGLDDRALSHEYARAGAFLCLSEHEGFCVPLLEAFAHGLPVVARAAAAIPEVTGDAALLLQPGDGVATVAHALDLVLGDEELRAELARRGRERLRAYDPARTAAGLREVLVRRVSGA